VLVIGLPLSVTTQGHHKPNAPSNVGPAQRLPDTRIMANEAGSWNDLHGRFQVERIDHGSAYSLAGGIYTNGAESFFSRIRRGETGHYHHIAGPYLVRYAQESAWREDHRRVDNGQRVQAVSRLAMAAPTSVDWCGYWQKAGR
jgi:hypothetical protein